MGNYPEPYIKLDGYEINDLNYTKDKSKISKYTSDFEFKPEVSLTEDKKQAKLTITASIRTQGNENTRALGVTVILNGFFTISDEIQNDQELLARTLIINGTAILFPYVRSMISMITGLDSAQTIVLPTVNTMDLFKKNH